MGDVEDETFETQDSGAAHAYPIEAGQIRKGGFIMIKGRPCKVSEVSTSKTGKHGHAKCHFVAFDIFTGKKIEDLVPASHTAYSPFVKKLEFQVMDLDEDGFLSVMDTEGNTRDDLKLPGNMPAPPPDAKELDDRIKELIAAAKDFYVVVQCACGTEQVIDTKVMTG